MNVANIDHCRLRRTKNTVNRQAPIKPHDPADRILLGEVYGRCKARILAKWEVRALDPAGPFHHYFAKSELLHLQLWNHYFGISLLTPSKLTGGRYEAYPLAEWKGASKSYACLQSRLENKFATTLPSESVLKNLTAEYCRTVASEASQMTRARTGKQLHG